jgi:hypothetical protein
MDQLKFLSARKRASVLLKHQEFLHSNMLPHPEDHTVDMDRCSTGIRLKNFETKINT